MSLQARDHCRLIASSPTWWAMAEARGEKMVRSAPRSRCSLSWAPSMLWRISSSLTFGSPVGRSDGSVIPASWASRKS